MQQVIKNSKSVIFPGTFYSSIYSDSLSKEFYDEINECCGMTIEIFGIIVKVFTNGLGDRDSIPVRVIPKTQKMLPCLPLSIIRYGSREK